MHEMAAYDGRTIKQPHSFFLSRLSPVTEYDTPGVEVFVAQTPLEPTKMSLTHAPLKQQTRRVYHTLTTSFLTPSPPRAPPSLCCFFREVYLTLAEWKNKKELEETDKYTSSGQLPPEIAKEAGPSNPDEEGNRLQRRMMKKEKRKSGKI